MVPMFAVAMGRGAKARFLPRADARILHGPDKRHSVLHKNRASAGCPRRRGVPSPKASPSEASRRRGDDTRRRMVPMFAVAMGGGVKRPVTSWAKASTCRRTMSSCAPKASPCGCESSPTLNFVIPAKAGTQSALARRPNCDWVPAFAGMTNEGIEVIAKGLSETARVGKFRVRSHGQSGSRSHVGLEPRLHPSP